MQPLATVFDHHSSDSRQQFAPRCIALVCSALLIVIAANASAHPPCAPSGATRTDDATTARNAAARKPSPPTLDLNRATSAELQTLPGIGQRKAERIVALRRRIGSFQHLAHLLRVRGIGRRTLAKLRPYLRLSQAPEAPQQLTRKPARRKTE